MWVPGGLSWSEPLGTYSAVSGPVPLPGRALLFLGELFIET